jgi:hypothetical protein
MGTKGMPKAQFTIYQSVNQASREEGVLFRYIFCPDLRGEGVVGRAGNEKTAKRISGFSRIVDFPIGIELDGSKIG